jgi:hypothetical protein
MENEECKDNEFVYIYIQEQNSFHCQTARGDAANVLGEA